MAEYQLVACPYDPVHRLKESRLQIHIVKCRQNHLSDPKFICPFNATHVLPEQEKKHHMINCPDQGLFAQKITENINRNNIASGRMAVPSYTQSQYEIGSDEERWDIDDTQQPPIAASERKPPPGCIIEPPPFSKPAERRQLYRELHQRTDYTDYSVPAPNASKPVEPQVPRQPTQQSQLQALKLKENALGIGRGKPNSNRIAANFSFNSASNPSSYSAVASDSRNPGLGRGQKATPISVFDQDDFPALGMGRGVGRNK